MDTNDKKLLSYLQTILDTHTDTIEHEVAVYLIDESSPWKSLLDLIGYGCEQCAVPGLIQYYETYSFFDTFYEQINELYNDSEVVLPKDTDMKNWMAWFAFEAVARKIYIATKKHGS